jgi:hypothetical protein
MYCVNGVFRWAQYSELASVCREVCQASPSIFLQWTRQHRSLDTFFIKPLLQIFRFRWGTNYLPSIYSILHLTSVSKDTPSVWVNSSEMGLKWISSLWGYTIKLIPGDFLWFPFMSCNSDATLDIGNLLQCVSTSNVGLNYQMQPLHIQNHFSSSHTNSVLT